MQKVLLFLHNSEKAFARRCTERQDEDGKQQPEKDFDSTRKCCQVVGAMVGAIAQARRACFPSAR